MQEIVLRRFFEGGLSSTDLAHDLNGSLVHAGPKLTRHLIEDMEGEFEVLAHHLIKVCDSVLDGSVPPESLESIGFCLAASDAFFWDSETPEGGIVANVIFNWAEHRINHSLNCDNVAKWRKVLLGEEVTWARG